jgi:hypothetical protein
MALSRVHRLETISDGHWEIWFVAFLFLYISALSVLFYIKKHEFIPFEQVKDQYLQVNPFNEPASKAPTQKLQGKIVVVKLNTMCNSLIKQSPEFDYLVFS